MVKRDTDPPLLRGFTNKGTERGKALSNPSTSLWLAIIFVALFFALMSVQRNVSKANEAVKPPENQHSGWIIDAPEKVVERDPPPNPDFLFKREEEQPITVQESIELKTETAPLIINPIDMKMDVKLPDEMRKADPPAN